MKNKIKQIFYDLRYQPVVMWVSVLATALSIFLIMVIVMMQRVALVPFSPESCRDHLLIGKYIHIAQIDDDRVNSSGGLSGTAARTLYQDLDGVKCTSYFVSSKQRMELRGTTGETFMASSRKADAEYFSVFDHPLQAGRYYTHDEAESNIPVVVLTEWVARKAFGTVECVGETLIINHNFYTVVGVVNDNSILAENGSGEIFMPMSSNDSNLTYNTDYDVFGPVAVALLVEDGVDFQSVRDQVKSRYAIIDTQMAPKNYKTVYHESPFDQETIAAGVDASNLTPDKNSGRTMRVILYAILLIVPAINLSTMLHSRMQRRISEIGVRRAYGCTRARVISDIISENLIVTVIGGALGLVFAIILAMTYGGLYENMWNTGEGMLTPSFSAVMNWGTFLIAFGICFVLNMISAAVPAWMASRVSPIAAINAK